MASRRITPQPTQDGTQPTIPPAVPEELESSTTTTVPPSTTTRPLTGIRSGAMARGGRYTPPSTTPVSSDMVTVDGTTVTGTYAGDRFRDVLGIGGQIEFDLRTGQARRYEPGSTGYLPKGGQKAAINLYVKGQGLTELAGLSPESKVAVQNLLSKAGYLRGGYKPGQISTKEVNAIEKAMADANINGVTWQEMATVKASSGGSGGYTRTQVRVSNPLDIEAAANKVAEQLMGRPFDEETMARFVTAYQQAERKGATGTTAAPNIQPFTVNKLLELFPTETYARQFGGYMEALQQRYGA